MTTSKEALERLLYMAKSGCKVDMCNVKYVENATDIIEKDLEVLEILKRHSTILDDEDWNSNIFNGIDYEYLNEEERKVIKEWLENEN